MKILQCNLNRSRVADDLLSQLVRERGADMLLISEQYREKPSSWYSDELGTSAIWVPDPAKILVADKGRGRGFVWVKCENITFVSVYLTPNDPIAAFLEKLGELEDLIVQVGGKLVVAGDFNARAVEWGMDHPDSRGKSILEAAARTGLLVLNEGHTSTFRRPGYSETIPDVTFASESLAPLVSGWEVLEVYTGSDHQYIEFQLHKQRQSLVQSARRQIRWSMDRVNLGRFSLALSRGMADSTRPSRSSRDCCEAHVDYVMKCVVHSCEMAIPRRHTPSGKRPVYWWTPEIADLRRECLSLRRRAQRTRCPELAGQRSADHVAKKKELRRAINASKARCYKQLREEIDTDPWGLGYKIVTQKLGGRRVPVLADMPTTIRIIHDLFPSHAVRPQRTWSDLGQFEPFSGEELERAIKSAKRKKAPGPDGLPSEVWRLVLGCQPNLMLELYNLCLSSGVFPKRWKKARLVLISKGKGDPDLSSYYRPISMLDSAGKILEKMLRRRLQAAVEAAGGLSSHQHGFRAGRSTIDAIAEVVEAVRRAEDHNHFSRRVVLLVTLDVRNAFNSARWSDMLHALEVDFRIPHYLLRMVEDYLSDRCLVYETTEGCGSMVVTAGAAQGSVLGPDLWNAAYDSLLRSSMPDECQLVGYADDVALLVAARNVEQAQFKLNQAMRIISTWMEAHGLSLALDKTEIVVLTKKRINTICPIRVGRDEVMTKPAAKYLGILMDCKLSFLPQILTTADKGAAGAASLSRLMANVGGPKAGRRRLLMSSVQSVLLYGSEIWAHVLSKEMYRTRLGQVQRRAALRVASAYRTVSEPAVLVIAGVIPIALLARERQAVFNRKDEGERRSVRVEERARTLALWQEEWIGEARGLWTRTLIKEVDPWLNRAHGEVDYFLTQFLSGHGYFMSYLHSMRKVGSASCIYCPDVRDTAEHTFFCCGRWAHARRELTEVIGHDISPDSVVGLMVQNEAVWNQLSHYIQRILREKKVDLEAAIIAERST